MTENKQQSSNNLLTLLVFISLLFTILTVVLSAYIRLSMAGVGCSPWPDCYGTVVSNTEYQGVAVLTETRAEMRHGAARVTHRLVASVLGVLIFFIAVIAWRHRKTGQPGVVLPTLLLGITVFLSLLGYLTPSPLIPIVTVLNIVGGMAMLAMLWWLGQRSVIENPVPTFSMDKKLRRFALLGLFIMGIQISAGGWTSANYAAAACPSVLTCGQSWSAIDMLNGLKPWRELQTNQAGLVVRNETMSGIHMLHRFSAAVTAVFLAWIAIAAIRKYSSLRITATAILVFLGLQITLGIVSILSQLSLALVTLHNTVAALLLLAIVNLYHLLTPVRSRE